LSRIWDWNCFQFSLLKVQIFSLYMHLPNSKSPYFLINFFKLYIRPILEYNVSIWMPYQVGDIRKIESVQATFMRICRKLNIKYESYKHCLSFFNLDTLEIWIIKWDFILIFKIIHNLIDLQFDDFFSISPSLKL